MARCDITLIAALTLLSLAWDLGRSEAAVLSAVLIGVSAGFLLTSISQAVLRRFGCHAPWFLTSPYFNRRCVGGAATIGLSVPILIFAFHC